MKWLGLTGGIGTGKSTVASMLRQRSVSVVDADAIVRDGLANNSTLIEGVRQLFGSSVLNSNGSVDRGLLGSIVFANSQKRIDLENLIHPFVQAEVRRLRTELSSSGCAWAVYDVPLLFEKDLRAQFDLTVVVACSEEEQIKRVLSRNPEWTLQNVEDRMKSQWPIADKVKLADFVIQNDSDLKHLSAEVDRLVSFMGGV